MFWFIYFLSSVLMSFFIARLSKENYLPLFTLLLVFFVTPTPIDPQGLNYAPSFFTFLFNIIFQEDFTARALRPLFLTLPLTVIFFLLHKFFKRKLF